MKPKLLTVPEAAALKGVTTAAIYTAISEGRLRHQKILGRIAVKEADVLAWTPIYHAGRRKGAKLSAEAKAKISEKQKQHWAKRRLK